MVREKHEKKRLPLDLLHQQLVLEKKLEVMEKIQKECLDNINFIKLNL